MLLSMLTPVLSTNLRPVLGSCVKQTRNMRPIIRKGKERFEITINVRQYKIEELRVKARVEYVTIEGKKARQTKHGCVIQQFTRKFKLPTGCNPATMKTKLSPDGVLTISAPRCCCDKNMPCETLLKIEYQGSERVSCDESKNTEKKPPC